MTTRSTDSVSVKPGEVLKALGKHLLVDGFHLVVDLDKSQGSRMIDASTGKSYLDFYSMFASNPIGFNHPRLMTAEFEKKLLRAARQKPANSDVYSVEMAEFVETLDRFAIPKHLPHLFLVEGGALGIENALKAAFDWKVQKNFARGYTIERGTQVIHFKQAFHGRTGYTLSLTNTDPIKTQYFPKFAWPRIDNPKIQLPDRRARTSRPSSRPRGSRSRRSSAPSMTTRTTSRRSSSSRSRARAVTTTSGRSSSRSCAVSRTSTRRCSSSTRSRPASG